MRIFVFLLCFVSFSALADQKARVVVEKAIIYSDLYLTSPIGQISQGKIITVGNVKRRHGTVLPIIVHGKVAYIRVRDLMLEKDFTGEKKSTFNTVEHDVSITFEKPTDKLNENNYIQVTGSMLGLGSSWQSLSNAFGEDPNNMFGFKAIFEHRPEIHNWSWGLGLDYYFTQQNKLSISMFAAEINVYYSLIPFFRLFTLDIMGGPIFSAATTITTQSDSYKSTVMGFQGGVQVRLFPYSQIGFTGGAKYVSLGFSNLDTIVVNTDTTAELTGFNGLEFYGGISYKF